MDVLKLVPDPVAVAGGTALEYLGCASLGGLVYFFYYRKPFFNVSHIKASELENCPDSSP